MKCVLTYSLASSGNRNYKLASKRICELYNSHQRHRIQSYEVAILACFLWGGLEKQW